MDGGMKSCLICHEQDKSTGHWDIRIVLDFFILLSLCVCMYGWIITCVHMCECQCVCIPVSIHHRMYVEVRSQPQMSVLAFSLFWHRSSCLLHHQANWTMAFQEFCLHLPSHHWCAGVTYKSHYTQLYTGSGNLNSDLQALWQGLRTRAFSPTFSAFFSAPSFRIYWISSSGQEPSQETGTHQLMTSVCRDRQPPQSLV